MNEPVSSVASPCTDVCRIDESSGLCSGCWRTLDEIASWPSLGDDGKRTVCEQIAKRRVEHPFFESAALKNINPAQ